MQLTECWPLRRELDEMLSFFTFTVKPNECQTNANECFWQMIYFQYCHGNLRAHPPNATSLPREKRGTTTSNYSTLPNHQRCCCICGVVKRWNPTPWCWNWLQIRFQRLPSNLAAANLASGHNTSLALSRCSPNHACGCSWCEVMSSAIWVRSCW